jgi:hypothetical protein
MMDRNLIETRNMLLDRLADRGRRKLGEGCEEILPVSCFGAKPESHPRSSTQNRGAKRFEAQVV